MGIDDAFRSLVAAPFRDVIFEWQVFNLGLGRSGQRVRHAKQNSDGTRKRQKDA